MPKCPKCKGERKEGKEFEWTCTLNGREVYQCKDCDAYFDEYGKLVETDKYLYKPGK